MTETLLDARGVGRRFGARWALRGVTLAVSPGETVALVGPNGAGKTTLLDILAGARVPTEGTVGRADQRVGFVPQRPALWRRLTTRENLELFSRLGRVPDAAREAQRLLEATDLEAVAERPTGQLSVGQRQRVNVASGLIGDPRVVLLDEPTASLDPRQRRLLWRLLAGVSGRGGAVVFTTQNVEEVALHADRLVALVDGSVVFSGTVAAFRAQAGSAADEGFEEAFIRFLDAVGGAA